MDLKLATVILACAFLTVGCKVNQQDRPGTPGTAAAPKTEPAPTAGAPPASSSSSTTIVNKDASGTGPTAKDQPSSSSSATVAPGATTSSSATATDQPSGSSATSSATATDKSGASTGAAGRAGQEDFSKEKPAQIEKQSGGQHSSPEQGGSTPSR